MVVKVKIRLIMICLLGILPCLLRAQNLALKLDGKDNNVRTGIGFIEAPWTLEAWIKGDDIEWKAQEVVFGGGEYSTYSQADNLPLVIEDGRLCSVKAGLKSSVVMDDAWHHVALTCDGSCMQLYVDGKPDARKDTAVTIIPGAIGVNEYAESVFGGMMDEVRIWNTSLSGRTIRKWMCVPLSPSHSGFRHLVAYYNFDAGIDDTALNWVGSGYQSYHLRNGRVDYYGRKPIACAVPADNPQFRNYEGRQRLFSVVPIENEWDADKGCNAHQMMKMRICVQGQTNPIAVKGFTLNLEQNSQPEDLSSIAVYYAGQTARSKQRELLYKGTPVGKKLKVSLPEHLQKRMQEGANYLLVTADVSPDACPGDTLRIAMENITLGLKRLAPEVARPYYIPMLVTESSATDSSVFRVLQWNIWHGGNHVPLQGKDRIVELIKASGADVVTMQEGYGLQETIASALGFRLQTPSAEDNLALFSRYPLRKLLTYHDFRSNPAMVTLPNGGEVLVDDCWLRFSTHPDYTGSYPDVMHNPQDWVKEDSVVPMEDARNMLAKDIEPVLREKDVPVVIGGDFNSCSHLDWTAEAAHLHAGYGPVAFPASRYMAQHGYTDTFRAAYPNEVIRPEGTFAGIYGQLDFSRIDFIYCKGNVRVLSSKIVQTQPEIDDIWPSDHSAVLTTFKYMGK